MKKKKINRRRLIFTLCFAGPAFLVHFCVVTLPALSMFYYAGTDWNGLANPVWTGLANFKALLIDKQFHNALLHSIVWTLIFLTVPFILGIGVAILIVKTRKMQMFYRTILFLPYVLSAAVAGKIWATLYNSYFGIPSIFKKLGLTALSNISFLGDSKIALYSVAFVDNWHWWGFIMVLMIAALQQVDPDLYEVGDLEGANAWQRLIYITLPQIRPTLVSTLMLSIMWSFVTFDYVYIMTEGGPGGATEILATYIYKEAYQNFNAGYANAISLFVCIMSLLVYFIFHRLQKKGWDI